MSRIDGLHHLAIAIPDEAVRDLVDNQPPVKGRH